MPSSAPAAAPHHRARAAGGERAGLRLGLGLAAGLVGGLLVGRTVGVAPAPLAPAPAVEVAASGRSGPGFSCPAREPDADEALECSPPPAAVADADAEVPAANPYLVQGPTCGVPTEAQHVMLTDRGVVPVPDGDRFWFGRYHGRPLTPMGDSSVINGARMFVAQLDTSDTPNEVAAFYKNQFEANHVRPAQGFPQGLHGPMYLAFTPKGDALHTLTLVPAVQGTLILGSVGTPRLAAAADPGDFPLPEGAQALQSDEVRDGPTLQRNMTFTAPGKVAAVRTFYLQALEGRGFEPGEESSPTQGAGATSWQQDFHRGADVLTLSAVAASDNAVAVSAMWISRTAQQGASR